MAINLATVEAKISASNNPQLPLNQVEARMWLANCPYGREGYDSFDAFLTATVAAKPYRIIATRVR